MKKPTVSVNIGEFFKRKIVLYCLVLHHCLTKNICSFNISYDFQFYYLPDHMVIGHVYKAFKLK